MKEETKTEVKDQELIELKSRAYDLLALMERAQAELQQVNQLISEKVKDDKRTKG
jgi:hypothetical protein